jgi:hypothetical protein
MAPLTVVATFATLPEAQIADGALDASGLHPEVMDQHFGSMAWMEQFALQGFRLAVPASEAPDAREFFLHLPKVRSRSPPARTGDNIWRTLAVLMALGLAPVFGWLMVGGLRRRRPGFGAEVSLGVVLSSVVVVLGLLAVVIVLGVVTLLIGPLFDHPQLG